VCKECNKILAYYSKGNNEIDCNNRSLDVDGVFGKGQGYLMEKALAKIPRLKL